MSAGPAAGVDLAVVPLVAFRAVGGDAAFGTVQARQEGRSGARAGTRAFVEGAPPAVALAVGVLVLAAVAALLFTLVAAAMAVFVVALLAPFGAAVDLGPLGPLARATLVMVAAATACLVGTGASVLVVTAQRPRRRARRR